MLVLLIGNEKVPRWGRETHLAPLQSCSADRLAPSQALFEFRHWFSSSLFSVDVASRRAHKGVLGGRTSKHLGPSHRWSRLARCYNTHPVSFTSRLQNTLTMEDSNLEKLVVAQAVYYGISRFSTVFIRAHSLTKYWNRRNHSSRPFILLSS
jgi:hypothetical protein